MEYKTLEQEVEIYNKAHPKNQMTKTLKVPIVSYKIEESDEGQITDEDSWEKAVWTLTVFPEERLKGLYISLHKSRFADAGYRVFVMRHSFGDSERGWCVSEVDIQSAPEEGIESKIVEKVKITQEEAAELLKTGKYIIKWRDGRVYKQPCVQLFKM
jgi:hypothetical protein